MNWRSAWLLAVPLTLVILSGLLVDARGPYNLGLNHDPEYAYLLNSLNILLLHSPGLVQHPGTTAQVLGSAVIFGKWMGGSLLGTWVPLQKSVLQDPEAFLHAINFMFILLIAGAVFYAGLRMYRASCSLTAALVLQLSFFLFRELLTTLPRADPEPILIVVGFALMVPVISLLLAQEAEKVPNALAAGAVVGFGFVTKFTSIPYLAVAALLKGWKQWARFAAAFLITSFILLLPILDSLPVTVRWVGSLLTHSHPYGEGPSGLPSRAELSMNFKALYAAEPFFFYWLVYYAFVLLALQFGARKREHPLAASVKRLLWVGLGASILQVAMATKHFVAPRYLVPSLVIPGLLNAFLVLLYASPTFGGGLRIVLASCGAALFVANLWTSAHRLKAWTLEHRQYQEEVKQLDQRRQALGDCTVIGYYTTGAGQYPLALASDFSGGIHGKMLETLYSDLIFFDGRNFLSFSLEPRQAQVRKMLNDGRCVLMEGWVLNPNPKVPSGLALHQVAAGASEVIYKLLPAGSATSCSPSSPSCLNIPANAISLEAEKFSSGSVAVDNSAYGVGIGVIISPQYPAYAEYRLPLKSGGKYDLWIRYASAEVRPLTVSVNGRVITKTACSATTGGWSPDDQYAWKIATLDLVPGLNTLRLESVGPFPAIDKLGVVPVKGPK